MHEVTILFRPISSDVLAELRTVESNLRERLGGDTVAFDRKALGVLKAIQESASKGRLAVQFRRNVVTGSTAPIVVGMDAGRADKRALASYFFGELVVRGARTEFDHAVEQQLQLLGHLAQTDSDQLGILIHTSFAGRRDNAISFAVEVSKLNGDLNFTYLARLFVHEGEAEQWEAVESKVGSLLTPEQILRLAGPSPNPYSLFASMIPEYCELSDGDLEGSQRKLVSYALYVGLSLPSVAEEFARRVEDSLSPAAAEHALLHLACLLKTCVGPQEQSGDIWSRAVDLLWRTTAQTSPETAGPAGQLALSLVRLPYVGFTPGLLLSLHDPSSTQRLLADAILEKQSCPREDLEDRLLFMVARAQSFMKDVEERSD